MKRKRYTLEDLLKDDSFLSFVLDDSGSSSEKWNQFIHTMHPEVQEHALQARNIILCHNDDFVMLSDEENNKLKERILKNILKQK